MSEKDKTPSAEIAVPTPAKGKGETDPDPLEGVPESHRAPGGGIIVRGEPLE